VKGEAPRERIRKAEELQIAARATHQRASLTDCGALWRRPCIAGSARAINGSVFMPAANTLVRSKCKGCSDNKIIEEALFRCGIFELNVAPLRTITG
jgi:hypothetical protein